MCRNLELKSQPMQLHCKVAAKTVPVKQCTCCSFTIHHLSVSSDSLWSSSHQNYKRPRLFRKNVPIDERKKRQTKQGRRSFLSVRPSFQTTNSLLVQFDKCSGNRRIRHRFRTEVQWELQWSCHLPYAEKNRAYVADATTHWDDIITVVRVTSSLSPVQIFWRVKKTQFFL